MGMVPEGPRLICLKGVQERVVGGNGTLGHALDTVHKVGAFLEHTMPMLLAGQERILAKCGYHLQ